MTSCERPPGWGARCAVIGPPSRHRTALVHQLVHDMTARVAAAPRSPISCVVVGPAHRLKSWTDQQLAPSMLVRDADSECTWGSLLYLLRDVWAECDGHRLLLVLDMPCIPADTEAQTLPAQLVLLRTAVLKLLTAAVLPRLSCVVCFDATIPASAHRFSRVYVMPDAPRELYTAVQPSELGEQPMAHPHEFIVAMRRSTSGVCTHKWLKHAPSVVAQMQIMKAHNSRLACAAVWWQLDTAAVQDRPWLLLALVSEAPPACVEQWTTMYAVLAGAF